MHVHEIETKIENILYNALPFIQRQINSIQEEKYNALPFVQKQINNIQEDIELIQKDIESIVIASAIDFYKLQTRIIDLETLVHSLQN